MTFMAMSTWYNPAGNDLHFHLSLRWTLTALLLFGGMAAGFRVDPGRPPGLAREGLGGGPGQEGQRTHYPWEVEGNGRSWMELALTALEAATRFFEKNYDRIILDGIFGLRVAEGQMVSALESLTTRTPPRGMHSLLPRVHALQQRMHAAAHAAMPYLLADNQQYFEVFSDMVYRPYVVSYSARKVALPMRKKAVTSLPPNYHEKMGDACFADLMGQSLSEQKQAPPRCTISALCAHMMTDPDKTDYTLTHQLLFFIQAQHAGCGRQVELLFRSKEHLANFEREVCRRVYGEATELSKQGWVEARWQDLFLEQGVVCGMIGFESFLHPDWLKMITQWQSTKGCFTDDDNSYIPKRFRRRHLLYEEEIQGNSFTGRGCLSHKSGLGISLLGIYVRYLLEHDGRFPPSLNVTSQRV